jgi:hypothetical protein
MRNTISVELREALKKTYPGLLEIIEFWRFLRYLIFGKKCEMTGNPLIDLFHLAKAEGLVHIFIYTKKYVGKSFLERFQQRVVSPKIFTWSD